MKDEIKEILEALKPQDEEFTKAGIKEYPLVLSIKEQKILRDYITNLQNQLEEKTYLYNKLDTESKYVITNLKEEINKLTAESTEWESKCYDLQKETDYLKDIVSNTELSDEIKKADKWSKRELYKINYQRLQVNKRLRKENEKFQTQNIRMKKEIGILCNRLDARNKQVEKAIDKLQTMFDNGNEQTILDDLLELNRILNGGDSNE